MDKQLIWAFFEQIRFQCILVVSEGRAATDAVQNEQDVKLFGHLQNLLSAAANIAKALWGQAGSLTIERQELRDRLQVQDECAIKATTMRNHYDHFDERLVRWWKNSTTHEKVDLCVTSPITALAGPDDVDRFREFDPHSGDLVFWGDHFNVHAIVKEADAILQRLTSAIEELY